VNYREQGLLVNARRFAYPPSGSGSKQRRTATLIMFTHGVTVGTQPDVTAMKAVCSVLAQWDFIHMADGTVVRLT
jgi:hypothetical protein